MDIIKNTLNIIPVSVSLAALLVVFMCFVTISSTTRLYRIDLCFYFQLILYFVTFILSLYSSQIPAILKEFCSQKVHYARKIEGRKVNISKTESTSPLGFIEKIEEQFIFFPSEDI